MASAQGADNTITLRGSTQVVAEFFGYAVNSILYQRGIYPPESFEVKKEYGLSLMVSSDGELSKYLADVLKQVPAWIESGMLQKLVLVVSSVASGEVLERWTFNVHAESPQAAQGAPVPGKSTRDVQSEIGAIIRQITASVTFLPLLDEKCSFDLLVYTDQSAVVPSEWEDSDPRLVNDAAEVKLRSFSTRVHKVDALVAYKQGED
ncbi:unnamed protein product [Pedinophyceae sp. YPF-701]|nr:unnamed protein product [Pedinophyceae sp. YPF-701]